MREDWNVHAVDDVSENLKRNVYILSGSSRKA